MLVRWSAVACFLASCGRVGFDPGTVDAGSSSAPVCGDGVVGGVEVCDDQNDAPGDGCENDCTFTCTTDGPCDDEEVCNGVEFCSPEYHVCKPGEPEPDGTTCAAMRACRGGACAPLGCGDSMVDSGEDCDDGNLDQGDGCENDCTFTCSGDTECLDTSICNGSEICDLTVHRCGPGMPPPRGTECARGDDRAICLDEMCVPSMCGDGFIDYHSVPPEQCDDANVTPGDGCEPNCTLSCGGDEDCSDGQPCNGNEECLDGTCHIGALPPEGTACGAGGMCRAGACITAGDAGPSIDAGTGCETDMDCPGGRCCETCLGFPNECWGGTICPITKCLGDGGLES